MKMTLEQALEKLRPAAVVMEPEAWNTVLEHIDELQNRISLQESEIINLLDTNNA